MANGMYFSRPNIWLNEPRAWCTQRICFFCEFSLVSSQKTHLFSQTGSRMGISLIWFAGTTPDKSFSDQFRSAGVLPSYFHLQPSLLFPDQRWYAGQCSDKFEMSSHAILSCLVNTSTHDRGGGSVARCHTILAEIISNEFPETCYLCDIIIVLFVLLNAVFSLLESLNQLLLKVKLCKVFL